MPKGSRRIPWDPEIKSLLVIAGLSGCGKSTFIRQLKRRRLPGDILRQLPDDIHTWHHAWGKRRLSHPLLRPTAKPGGQIFHFDMTTSTAYRTSFEERPAASVPEPHREEKNLNNLLGAAEKVQIVVITAPKDQLIRQLSGRAAVTHLPAPLRPLASRAGPLMLGLERLLPARAKDSTGRFGTGWARRSDVRSKNFRNCLLYTHDAKIKSVHAEWENTVLRQAGVKLVAPTTYVEPAPNGLGRRKFRLVLKGARQTQATASDGTSFGRLQHLANVLDNAMQVPGTKLTVGADALLGIIPLIGDALSGSIGAYIIWKAGRLGAPRRLVLRMLLNSSLDTLVGCIPIVGDIFDASYKSNLRNVTLLRRHLTGAGLFRAALQS